MDNDIRTVTLEKIKFGVQQVVSEQLLEASVDSYYDAMIGGFVITAHGSWLGEPVKDHVVKYPRDWWQAFKERWFPGWALRRWPVVYSVHHMSVKAVYPDFKPSLPKYAHKFTASYFHDEEQ